MVHVQFCWAGSGVGGKVFLLGAVHPHQGLGMWGAPHSHEEPHPICSSPMLGFSEAALCGGREGESGEDQPATQINLFPISGRAMRVWYFTKQFLPVIGSRCGMFPGQPPAAWRAELHRNCCRIPLGRIPCAGGRRGTAPDPCPIPSEPRPPRERITENRGTI